MRAGNLGVLVEPRGEPERVREPHSQGLDSEARIVQLGLKGRGELQPDDRGAVRRFRRQKLKERLRGLGQPHPSRLPKS